MSQHSTQLRGPMGRHFGHFGDPVTYVPAEGAIDPSEVSISFAIVGGETREEELDGQGRIRLRFVRLVSFETDSTGDRYSGVESPQMNASLIIGDIKYAVDQVQIGDSGTATLRLIRKPMGAEARAGYYR